MFLSAIVFLFNMEGFYVSLVFKNEKYKTCQKMR